MANIDPKSLSVDAGVSKSKVKIFKRLNQALYTEDLKKGVWLYFILLIFEGALRKWVFPGLASPLLIVRDPVAIWLIVVAWRRGVLVTNIYLTIILLIAIIGIVTATLVGHGSFLVALFGARIIIVHFPMIFIIGRVFDREDILKIGKFLVWLSIPMTVLLVLQFYSPQSAWVNRGIGNGVEGNGFTEGGGFSGALGFFRAPTTFSFTNGTAFFYSLTACFVFYFWIVPYPLVKRPLLLVASVALLMSIPFSISRTLFFSVLVTAFFVVTAVTRNRKSFGRIIGIAIVLLVLTTILSQLNIFQTATEAFSSRLTNASESEGGLTGTLVDRYLGGLVSAIASADQLPFFGYGIGSSTNVGNLLLTGKIAFAVGEQEWARLVSELGIVMGLTVIAIRLILSFKIGKACYSQLSNGYFLPWILLSNCLLLLPQGQWSQSTALGFCVVAAGFTIASLKVREKTSIN